MDVDTPKESFSRGRWVILAASFCCLLLTGYGQFNAGVMKVALIRHWDSDVSTTTWLASYYVGGFALTAPVGSILINLVNCRACVVLSGVICLLGYVLSSLVTDVFYLFFTLTLVVIGQGMVNTGSLVILGYYFPDKTSIATGVSFAGGALGIFVHPPLMQAFVDWYGLRGAFLLSGAVAFHSCVGGALMKPARLELRASQSKRQGNALQRICHVINDACSGHMTLLGSRALLAVLISVLFMSLAIHVLMVQLPAYLIRQSGLTPTEAAFSLSVYGIGSFFSRIASGFIAHDPRIGNRLVYCGLMGVHALASLAAPSLLTKGVVGAYVYLMIVGIYSGGCFSLYMTLVYDVSIHHFSTAFGISQFVLGVGGLLGAPLSEQVYDDDENPYIFFGFVAALLFASAVFGSLVTTKSTSQTSPEKQHSVSVVVHGDNDDDPGKIPEQETLLTSSQAGGGARESSTPCTQEEMKLLELRSNHADHHRESVRKDSPPCDRASV